MEKPLEAAWEVPQVGRGRVLGNYHGGVSFVTWFDGDLDLALAYTYRLDEGMAPGSTSFQGGAVPPSLVLKLYNLLLTQMSLMLFELLPQSWSSE